MIDRKVFSRRLVYCGITPADSPPRKVRQASSGIASMWCRIHIAVRDGWLCRYCGVELTPDDATVDHLVPVRGRRQKRSKWYWNIQNLVMSCRQCNLRKG